MTTDFFSLEVENSSKECYVSPEYSVIELEQEGILCSSNNKSHDTVEDFVDGGEYGRSSRGW